MKSKEWNVIAIVCLITSARPVQSYAQEIGAQKAASAITVDGVLSEPDWAVAEYLSDFTQVEPRYGEPSNFTTRIRILYDTKMIYFGIECLDGEPQKISSKVTKRDGEVWQDDAVALVLDTFDDDNNAYFFIFNSLGTQQDERWADNGRTRDLKWDVTWLSAGAITDSGWTAEAAFPFEVLKYDKGNSRWGFNAIRYVPRNLEMSHWVANLSQWFRISEIGSITNLFLDEVSGKQLTFIPYVQSQLEKGEKPAGDAGGDLRVNLTSNLGLEMTVNPDFATVEADVEQVNLTRFELSYPEKRPFFMEGAENYSTRIKQFYSRRIGEIPWGLKINGKINSWKVNVLATQSDPSSTDPSIDPGEKALYTVFRINRDLKNASTIGLIGANRNYDGRNKGSLGLAGTLFFSKYFGMTTQLVKSYGNFTTGTWTYFIRPAYDSQTGHFHVRYTHVGEHVRENINDIGFIRDDDRREVDSNIKKQFWINRAGIEDITASINYNQYWSQIGTLRSWEVRNNLSVKFLKRWSFSLKYNEEFKHFEKDFRNDELESSLQYDNKKGNSVIVLYSTGYNFDRDMEQVGAALQLKLSEGWNFTYHARKYWFRPDVENDNSLIHYIRSTFYLNKDLYCKLFYQSKYDVAGGIRDPDFEISRETIQFVFVWRFLPPFGALQIAYQEGTTRATEMTGRARTLFSKLSWMF